MTNQELYSTSRKHLLAQGAKAVEKKDYPDGYSPDLCQYRTAEGLKCAIGCLIPDDRYSPALEGRTVMVRAVREAAGITVEQELLACALQRVHDTRPVQEWERRLDSVAIQFSLEPR